MTTAKPKFTYFELPGRGEAIRVLCVANDIPFEDERISFDVWPQRKPDTPFGGVPVLQVPGHKTLLGQSNAILRYFGKQCGAYPSDPFEAAQADAVCDRLEEINTPLGATFAETDPEKRKALREAVVRDHFLVAAAQLQKLHESLGNPTHFVGNKLSIADYRAAALCSWVASGQLDGVPVDTFSKFPVFAKAEKSVYEQAKVMDCETCHPK